MNNVFIIKTLDIPDEKINKLCKYVSYEKRTKVNKFLNRDDKIQTIVADILVRIKLISFFNIRNKDIYFSKNIYGKPYIEKFKNFYFNISHSGKYVVVAISDKEIGVDIEKIEDIDYLDIAKNYFNDKELKYIIKPNNQDELEKFYDIWTLKESYIKFKGKGLLIPLDSFAIYYDDNNNIKVIDSNNITNHIFNKINILKGYKLSLCKLDNEELNIEILNQDKLIDNFLELIEKENIYL